MEANILDGVYIKVGGEAGKTKGLSWHILENMFSHLQQLIKLLAKYEIETDASPNLKEFEIEIFDFKPGSAVPAFRLVPKQQQELIPIIKEQKLVVANKFDQLMAYANEGDYQKFFRDDLLPEVKHDIAEELFGFILSAERSPLSIVKPINTTGDFHEIYKVPRFTKEQSEKLLKPKKRRKVLDEPEQILALVQRIGKRRTIVDLYENKDTILSIAPMQIVLKDKIYELHTPLLCTVQKEDENYIIENEMLDLYAAGETIDEAEHDFYDEFDASFQLLNNLSDEELSERLLRAKRMMNNYVKEIINQ
jgi:hypothetical protein